ncbi:MAG: pitrilysin family protein [Bacteroidales bacterium]
MQNTNSEYQWETLPNGLRIIYRYAESDVSYCGFSVNVGTRDESHGLEGIAHYVEHMLFKGTEHRTVWHILNRMENVGGEMNAYTAKEETVIYSVHLEPDIKRSVELMADLIWGSKFPNDESEREKEVIVDEINSYRDNPAELIYDEFENLMFGGHALGHNILGDINSIKAILPEDGRKFLSDHYTPANMVFFFTGKTPYKKVVKLLETFVPTNSANVTVLTRNAPDIYNPFFKTVKSDNYQAHAIIGNRCYNMFDDRRIPLFLISNILAGPGMNSLLNIALRERRGYVYTVESSATCYTDTGVFAIYFGTDHANINKCFSVIKREFSRLRDNKMTSSRIDAVKKQFIGQLAIGRESRESLATATGKSFLHYGKCETFKDSVKRIEGITSSQILDVANEVLDDKQLSTLIFK